MEEIKHLRKEQIKLKLKPECLRTYTNGILSLSVSEMKQECLKTRIQTLCKEGNLKLTNLAFDEKDSMFIQFLPTTEARQCLLDMGKLNDFKHSLASSARVGGSITYENMRGTIQNMCRKIYKFTQTQPQQLDFSDFGTNVVHLVVTPKRTKSHFN